METKTKLRKNNTHKKVVDVDFGLSIFIRNNNYIELHNEYGEVLLLRDSDSPQHITTNQSVELTDTVVLVRKDTH